MTKIETLLSAAPQVVFTISDLAVLWNTHSRYKLARVLNYYVRAGRLHPVRRGVYALTKNYPPLQAAIKLFPPAYISFTTALAIHGISFQHEQAIHAMATTSKTIALSDGQEYIYHQLKSDILLNPEGVEQTEGYWLASLERAICDTSYLIPSFSFEHIDRVDPDRLRRMAAIYKNRALTKRMNTLSRQIEEQHTEKQVRKETNHA